MKKMLFILNPCAGTKKANKALTDILAIFNRAGYDVHTYVTAGPKDAIDAVKQYGPGTDTIVCCGGDGTFNETITGLLENKLDIPIGYIPAGSTNDFAHSLHLSTTPTEAAQQIVDGSPEVLDLGQFDERFFSYIASFGAFTRASYATSQSMKNALGHMAYILGGIRELSQIHKIHARIELDDEVLEDDYIFGAICNSTSVGGILSLNPEQVDMSDGQFEVLLARSPKSLGELTECIGAIRKHTYNCRMLSFRSAKQVKIHTEKELDWTLDGEKASAQCDVAVTNLYHAVRLIK